MKLYKTLLSTLLLSGASAWAGIFTADFATQDTSQFFYNGSGVLSDGSTWEPVIISNPARLQLTTNQNTLSGSFSPIDFDGGAQIEAFTAKFKLQFGPGSANAADGAAFSFGPDINQFSTTYNEVGAGGTAFAVSFHTYTSIGGPAVDIYLYGTRIATFPMAKSDMVNSQLQDVQIDLKRNSTLSVSYRGQVVCTNVYLEGWMPTAGFFIISGRTGGENEETDIANVNIKTTLFSDYVVPTITSDPTNYTVSEGSSASFAVSFDGTGPFAFQWYQDGSPIQDATQKNLTISPAHYADNNAKIKVDVSNPAGTVTSKEATMTVIRDTTPLTVASVSADKTFTTVVVKYSKPVSDSALVVGNYSIDSGITISDAQRISTSTIQLTTSKLAEGTGYNVTINNVQDTASIPNAITANTKVHFQTFQFMNGTVVHQKYTGFDDNAGSNPDNLFADSRFPNLPDRRDLLTAFEYPANGGGFNSDLDSDKLFFDTMDGYFIPPTSGDYVFFIAFSDRGWLFLSTDEDPANKVMIAGTTGWSDPRSWLTSHDFDVSYARSDQAPSSVWPAGLTITLEAGKRYYMMMVHHMPDWAGGSWQEATYKLASDPDPANGTASTLTGSVIGTYIDPTGTSVTFTQQPQNVVTVQNRSVAMVAAAVGVSPYGTGMSYQWQTAAAGSSTWTNISGAISATLQIPLYLSTLADNGRQFRLVCTVAPVSQASSAAVLTVNADTTPPTLSAGAMQGTVAGTIDIGIGFDEPIDDSTGSALANYTVSSGTITAINWYSNRFTENSLNPLVMTRKQNALLTVSGFTGTSGSVTVKNVKDVYGNTITPVTLTFTVDTARKWGVVGGHEFGGWNAVVPLGAGAWDIYSDGLTEWASYDESTFVYEPVTGDFDKKVQVIYQDGSSEWARAGLIVRDVLNFGVDRATQSGGAAGRYQKCHVNPVGPVLTGPGTAGNASWEGNRRLITGGTCDSAISSNNATPIYPNGWCRIQRVGQKFTIYRSDDGVNWLQLGATTWGVDTPLTMPDTVYVGPEYSPEIGNITQASDQGTFLAQFRNYGDYTTVVDSQLKISKSADKITITWSGGTLVSSDTINGTYSTVTGATSPYVVTPSSSAKFFKIKQ